VFIALGLARFSYTLVLPSMRDDLELSYGRAGMLGTANTFGYLIGSLVLAGVTARHRPVVVFRVGVVMTVVAIAATGLSRSYPVLLAARAAAGCFGAAAFILGSVMAAVLAGTHRNAVAVFNGGAGAGIVLGGLVVPALLRDDPGRWPIAWGLLAIAGAAVAAVTVSVHVDAPAGHHAPAGGAGGTVERHPLGWLAAAYVCFGGGYIVYVTFLVATVRASGAGTSLVAVAFTAMGVVTLASPLLWRRALASASPPVLVAVAMGVQAVAALVLAVSSTPVAVVVSTVLFGSSFMMTPALVTATTRSSRPPSEWASSIGRITALFAVAQAIAPWVSGELIDAVGTAAGPLWTAGFSLAAVVCCAFAPRVSGSRG
jgi:predicted MFS family arabinose efflux permease